jgi:alpha-tubulin suppressor-like RCC1 family protein
MHRSLLRAALALSALSLAACSGGVTDADAGTDAGGTPPTDAGTRPDGGPRPDSGPRPDGGTPPGCTVDCEFVELGLGADHSCARRANGEVWCWGRGQEGQLGDNRSRHENCSEVGRDPIDCSSTPVQVRTQVGGAVSVLRDATQISSEGGLSNCAVRATGELWCWGLEGIARANGGSQEYRIAAQRVEDFGEISAVSDGWLHTCMVRGAGDNVVCYGFNESGQLGVGDRVEIRIPDASRAVLDPTDATRALAGVDQVTAAGFGDTTCALVDGRVWCWGTNRDGQLGDGSLEHETCTPSMTSTYDCIASPVLVGGEAGLAGVTQITAGTGHVCALDAEGQVWCWGDNRAGQLAQAVDVESSNLPVQVAGLGAVAEVDAAGRLTCARLVDGTVWCWGFNSRGQLGDGLMSHDTMCTFGDTTSDCSRVPVQVEGIDDATELAVGNQHVCVIRETGGISCWGYNDTRQLGDGTRTTQYAPVPVLGLPD